jgi:REP element-mobilizing transposase RayT
VPNQVKQRSFKFRPWGGKRRNAGAKPRQDRSRVSHEARPILKRRFPVHVTVRMRREVCHLRQRVCFAALRSAFVRANERFGFRLVHFSIQGNHIHFLVEAEDARSLSRGMQGLNVRMARGLNRLTNRRGKVLADRYHAVILQTPTQTAHALHYVLHNRQHHAPGRYAAGWRDPFASATQPLLTPRTWLLENAPPGHSMRAPSTVSRWTG